jgi:exopolysaccharide biosynthesis polyprenyl glycosylphosphotransferase
VKRHPEFIVELAGRAVVIFGVVVAVLSTGTDVSSGWAGVVALACLFAVHVSVASRSAALYALGPAAAVARGTALGMLGGAAIVALLDGPTLGADRIVLCALLVWPLVTLWEAAFERWWASKRRVLVVGTTPIAAELVRSLAESPSTRFEAIGVVDDGSSAEVGWSVPVLGQVDDLPEIISRERPALVVVALERNRPTAFGYLLDSAEAGFRVVEAPQFFEHAFGRVPVGDVTRAWFMSVLHLYQGRYSSAVKRVFDVIVALALLVVTLPLLPLLALGVRLSRGPLIIRQVRVGEHGRLFTMLKFRTMRFDAEDPGQALWAREEDPRVTTVGRLMRRFRLDEIPQLWNVMRGDMAIVGPRPERPEFMEFLEHRVPFWTRRHLVKPGITGWAQVRRGYTSDAQGSMEKLSYDLWYLRHRSILVDVVICLQTIGVLLNGSTFEPRRPVVDPDAEAAPEATWPAEAVASGSTRNS